MVQKIQYSPRKSPVQARSLATVEVILEATIQVLTFQGLAQLTTARVAERAGLSVGSVYQYYPNKQALLLAVLSKHLENVVHTVEFICHAQRGKSLEEMAMAITLGFVAVKLQRPEVSRALYSLPTDKEIDSIVARATTRGQLAICDLLATCPAARFPNLSLVASVLAGSLIGPVQLMLTGTVPVERKDDLTDHLVRMTTAYLKSVSQHGAPPRSKTKALKH